MKLKILLTIIHVISLKLYVTVLPNIHKQAYCQRLSSEEPKHALKIVSTDTSFVPPLKVELISILVSSLHHKS
ncbi:hypothetical protein BpHYR1_008704 [Brachionus plicatilis]|uniref:Secreted protein n=1 Tax=Brachionus plicatilis TaxID=10195 RepID=A0A3M7TBR4_BRAPC|nr:hypothetical protein BpHYR1_008704 [Brachionus plicatilis]